MYTENGRCDAHRVTIRGEEIKAHAKKKRDVDSSHEEEPSDDDGGGNMRRGAGKSADKDGKSGKAGMWFSGCYGCGVDHRWTACHAVGPIGQKERCTRCGKKGHIAKVCTEAAAARAAFLKNNGKPWEFEQNLPDDKEGQHDRDPGPEKRGVGDRDRDRDRRHRGRSGEKAHSTRNRSQGRARSGTRDRSGDQSRHKSRDRRRDLMRDRRKKCSRAAAATRVETRRSPGAETRGAAEAGATAETAGPRLGIVMRGERTSPRGFRPHKPSSGKGFCRRPRTGRG